MPNGWNHSRPIEVLNVETQYVEDYGFIYFFLVQNKKTGKEFWQASPDFSKKEIKLGPNATYHYVEQHKRHPFISLNRGEGEDRPWAIQKAKVYFDERQKTEEGYKKKLEDQRGEPASEEFKEDIFRRFKEEYGKESGSNNWYKSAKAFIQRVVNK